MWWMSDRLWWGVVLCCAALVAALSVAPTWALAALAAAIAAAFMLARGGMWRSMIVVSFTASLARGHEEVGAILSVSEWHVAQFAPLVVAVVALAARPSRAVFAPAKWLWLFSVVAGGTLLVSSDRAETAITLGMLVLILTFGHLSATRRWIDPGTVRGDLALVFSLAVIAQTIGLSGRAGGAEWAVGDYDRYVGLTSNANFAGVLSAITLPLVPLVARDRSAWGRLTVAFGAAALFFALLVSGSRGALLAAVAGVLVAGAVRTEQARLLNIAWVATLAAVVVAAYNSALLAAGADVFVRDATTNFGSGRLGIYQLALTHWQQSPLLGTGFGTSEGTVGLAAHNIFLTALLETGAVGATLFVVAIVSLWRTRPAVGGAATLSGAIVAVLFVELTESTLFGLGGPTALLSWIVLLAASASGATARSEPEYESLSAQRSGRVPGESPSRSDPAIRGIPTSTRPTIPASERE